MEQIRSRCNKENHKKEDFERYLSLLLERKHSKDLEPLEIQAITPEGFFPVCRRQNKRKPSLPNQEVLNLTTTHLPLKLTAKVVVVSTVDDGR